MTEAQVIRFEQENPGSVYQHRPLCQRWENDAINASDSEADAGYGAGDDRHDGMGRK